MKIYRVETIDGDTVVNAYEARALTRLAAAKALGQPVTLRGNVAQWVRVTDLSGKPPARLRRTVFENRALGGQPILSQSFFK